MWTSRRWEKASSNLLDKGAFDSLPGIKGPYYFTLGEAGDFDATPIRFSRFLEGSIPANALSALRSAGAVTGDIEKFGLGGKLFVESLTKQYPPPQMAMGYWREDVKVDHFDDAWAFNLLYAGKAPPTESADSLKSVEILKYFANFGPSWWQRGLEEQFAGINDSSYSAIEYETHGYGGDWHIDKSGSRVGAIRTDGTTKLTTLTPVPECPFDHILLYNILKSVFGGDELKGGLLEQLGYKVSLTSKVKVTKPNMAELKISTSDGIMSPNDSNAIIQRYTEEKLEYPKGRLSMYGRSYVS